MDFSTNSTSINMNMYIQPANLPIKDISEFPSKQAEAIQKHLLELDKQGKLKEEFLNRYGNNLSKPNSLANYILEDFENRKHLFIEWTGIETFSDKHTIAAIGIKINEVSYGISKRDFLWKCNTCQYEWVATPNARTSKSRQGCPKCGRLRTIEAVHLRGETLDNWCDANGAYGAKLKSEFIGKLWNGELIKINNISKGSHDNAYWKCSNPDCSYVWTARVNDRTSKQRRGCPACSRNQLIKGVNDLETYCHQHPELAYILEEFTGLDENNKPILASEVARANNKKDYWKCNKCHKRWLTSIGARTGKDKTGCPHCNKIGTSFPEQYIYHSLLQLFPNTKNRQKDIIKHYEYDIVIPELTLCIEYSGYGWHKDKLERDQDKANNCEENGAHFLQIYGHIGDMIEQDTYTKEKIIYQALNNKSQHIIQLQHIIKFILEQYAPTHSIQEINFELAEQQANKVMGKA